jgi:hypothetical protein
MGSQESSRSPTAYRPPGHLRWRRVPSHVLLTGMLISRRPFQGRQLGSMGRALVGRPSGQGPQPGLLAFPLSALVSIKEEVALDIF